MKARPRVVVLGGGFAGLESAFYLVHRLADRVDVTLVSDRDSFVFKPNTIYIPFGEDPGKYVIPLKDPTTKKRIRLVTDAVTGIDPDKRKVFLEDGELVFDYVVVATGAGMRPEEVPGLKEHALTVWEPEEMVRLREGLWRLVHQGNHGSHFDLLFLVPPNNRCSGPLYEMCLMTDTWLRREGAREPIRITWATYEQSFLQAFGPRLDTVVKDEFEERDIEGFHGWFVTGVEPGFVHFQNGERRRYDLLVSFPPYVARVPYPTLPIDDRGFIRVEPDSRRVKKHDRIFAAGDAADFPIKQAFLALLQGDAAADHIASEITGEPARVKFEPMSMCLMEELNKATFAQVPLRHTGSPEKPVQVDAGDGERYKIGVSPIWRAGTKVLGMHLPWRFASGEPFHAGFAWEAMDLGQKVMAKVAAD